MPTRRLATVIAAALGAFVLLLAAFFVGRQSAPNEEEQPSELSPINVAGSVQPSPTPPGLREDFFQGVVTVGLTDTVPASGSYVIQNIYNPNVREVLAIVQIENAKPGMEVIGRWYQMAVLQQKLANTTPQGLLISEAGFRITTDAIASNGRGAGRLSLQPNAPLPEDSYELRVYIDGKLAKVQAFVISSLVPRPR